MLGLPTMQSLDLSQIKILILDTGLAADADVLVKQRRNFETPRILGTQPMITVTERRSL